MRVGTVPSKEVVSNRYRLTGGFHLSEDQRALRALQTWSGSTIDLETGCLKGGLFKGQIFKRVFIDDSDHGVPYVSAKDLERVQIRPPNYLAPMHGRMLDRLRLAKGMLLLTRSGMNLGQTIWVRDDMTSLCGTDDLIRILPDENVVARGYLFLFLSSVYGRTAIRQQIYGGNIKHIEPEQVAGIRIPRLPPAKEAQLSAAVDEAFSLRERACQSLAEAGAAVEAALRFPRYHTANIRPWGVRTVASEAAGMRLDATYYSDAATWSDSVVRSTGETQALAEAEVVVLETPRMKQLFVEQQFGVPFFTSGDIFRNEIVGERFLARSALRGSGDWSVQPGDVLVARSGQVGGIIGRCAWADKRFADTVVSPHVLRLRVGKKSPLKAGYLYAYLGETDVGYRQLVRLAAGSSVPFLDANEMRALRIPIAPADVQARADRAVRDAGEQLARAQLLLEQSAAELTRLMEAN